MRAALITLPIVAIALSSTAVAKPLQDETAHIQRVLNDPQWADRVTNVMLAMSRAFMDLPVGEVEAAVQGRQPTAADKRRTVQSETGMSEQQLQQQIEQSRPKMEAGMRAMAVALPAIMKGFSDAQHEMDKATANVPRPDYPKR
jgi:hypothetical protein